MQSFSRVIIEQFLGWFRKLGKKYASERQSIRARLLDCLSCRNINVELEVTRLQVYSSSYKSTLDAISKLVISDFYGYNNLILTKKLVLLVCAFILFQTQQLPYKSSWRICI